MKKETLKQRLTELDLAAQQQLANYNAILGAKNEVQNLINYLDSLEQKEKLEAEIKENESAAVNDCIASEECKQEIAANGN